jgi:sodium/potassium-transporting ATPase subunit alpha
MVRTSNQLFYLTRADSLCFRKPLGNPNPNPSNLALAVVLLVVSFLQAIFNAWQDFSTSRVMASIKGMIPSDVLVLRDSEQSKLPARDLVPGDLVTFSMGEKIPADMRLIEVSPDLQFDRSILTGEVCRFPMLLFSSLIGYLLERTYDWTREYDGSEFPRD